MNIGDRVVDALEAGAVSVLEVQTWLARDRMSSPARADVVAALRALVAMSHTGQLDVELERKARAVLATLRGRA